MRNIFEFSTYRNLFLIDILTVYENNFHFIQ
jgi:hypothetical protein